MVNFSIIKLFIVLLVASPTFIQPSEVDPKILFIRLPKKTTVQWGGVAQHTLTLYKKLLHIGLHSYMIIPRNSALEQHLLDQKLPFFTFQNEQKTENLLAEIINICKKYQINIVYINFIKEIEFAKELRSHLGNSQSIHIIYHQHGAPSLLSIDGIDALISINKSFLNSIDQKKSNIKTLCHLPPLTEMQQKRELYPFLSKSDFFEQKFGVKNLGSSSILCCVAHFFKCKNHEVLFEALRKVIYQHKIPVHLMLAGDGEPDRIEYLKKITRKFGLEENVHFLGFVSNIQELLYYSDIKILASNQEPFGLAAIEAALMSKPIIISKNSGVADSFIFHKKTGLLCNPLRSEDIANQIKYLIENPLIAAELGHAAHDLVSSYYFTNKLLLEYVKNFKRILDADNEANSFIGK